MQFLCQSFTTMTTDQYHGSGLAGKNLRDLFPRVRGKKGVITQFFPRFFPSMGKKPISTDLFTQPK